MIFGDCPYCDEPVMNYMPDESPKFVKRICEACKNTYWLLCSRTESAAYTQEDFEKGWEINEEEKSIRPKKLNTKRQ